MFHSSALVCGVFTHSRNPGWLDDNSGEVFKLYFLFFARGLKMMDLFYKFSLKEFFFRVWRNLRKKVFLSYLKVSSEKKTHLTALYCKIIFFEV